MISTVIFDLDGLLSDTETLHIQAYQKALQAHGIVLTDEEYSRHWIRDGLGIDQFVVKHQLSLPASVARQEKELIFQELLDTSLQEMPGASELIESLYPHKRLAVASSSYRRTVEQVLQRLDLARYMELVVAREDVEHAKPAPDLFIHAAKQLNVPPSECVVVEDAEKGIVAAKQAGMKSIAVPNRYTRNNDFSAASYVVESLLDVKGTLELL